MNMESQSQTDILILGVDIETNGLNPQNDEITEVGAILYHWGEKRAISTLGEVVRVENAIPAEIEKLAGISNKLATQHGSEKEVTFALLDILMSRATYLMAHNAEFDRSFLSQVCPHASQRPWLCSQKHVPYPADYKSQRLGHLAMEQGFLNPFPHQAVSDVQTMLRVVSQYNLNEIVYRSQAKKVYLHAAFDRQDPNFETKKELAKKLGYKWNPAPLYKWLKGIFEFDKDRVMTEERQYFQVYEVVLAEGQVVNA